ncbi:MAG: hypothetical protein WCG92_24560, partial [Hyphomicrobiales bacterium]
FFDELPGPAAVWERVSRAGGRSLVIDQYESWIPRETEGLRMLNGWQFKHKLSSPFSTPRGPNRDLGRRFGPGPSIEFPYGRPSQKTLDRLIRIFHDSAARLADATAAVTANAAKRQAAQPGRRECMAPLRTHAAGAVYHEPALGLSPPPVGPVPKSDAY